MRLWTISSRAPEIGSRELSGLSEGQARGGGSSPVVGADANSLVGAEISKAERTAPISPAVFLLGRSAADEGAWHAGVQQSFFAWTTGLFGILTFIVQPGMPLLGWAPAPAVTGANARPRAQRIEIISRTMPERIGGED